jgi:hypothetical protein
LLENLYRVFSLQRYTEEHPSIFAWEIRDRLRQDKICTEETLPSVSSIKLLLCAPFGPIWKEMAKEQMALLMNITMESGKIYWKALLSQQQHHQ